MIQKLKPFLWRQPIAKTVETLEKKLSKSNSQWVVSRKYKPLFDILLRHLLSLVQKELTKKDICLIWTFIVCTQDVLLPNSVIIGENS